MSETCDTIVLRPLASEEGAARLEDLSALLVDAVAHGASVNFMAGYSLEQARDYWQRQLDGLLKGDRLWIVAECDNRLVGTVMCVFAGQPNQPFRAEISKMIVHSSQRGRGIGSRLMREIERAALAAGKTHLILDTETGSAGDRLYRRMGWKELGTMLDFAYAPDGSLAAATVFYKQLAPAPQWRGKS